MALVLDKHKRPLSPTTPKRAHKLLISRRARLYKRFPYTIRMVDVLVENAVVAPLVLKIDPGAKVTGMALVRLGTPTASPGQPPENSPGLSPENSLSPDQPPEASLSPEGALPAADPEIERSISILPARMPSWETPQFVLGYFELVNRGRKIHLSMLMRSMHRRRRRSENLWYREERFNNRKRPEGWLAPSIRHRVEGVEALVKKLMRLAPIASIVLEDNKFDPQAIMNPEISGVEYQQGDLYRREAMEYLLEKWGRKCVYCETENEPLQMDHVVPKSKGGSDRVSNLVPACKKCNQKKGSKDLEVYLKDRPELLKTIKSGLKKPLRGAAVMNSLRHVIKKRLEELGVPVISTRASITKLNRGRFGVPKFHAGDAACAGPMSSLEDWNRKILVVTSMGRGKKRRETHNEFGFPWDNNKKPRRISPKTKSLFGYATGDIVRGTPTKGKYKGQSRAGRVVVASSGDFYIYIRVEKEKEEAKTAEEAKTVDTAVPAVEAKAEHEVMPTDEAKAAGGKKAKAAGKAKGGKKAKAAGKAKGGEKPKKDEKKWVRFHFSHKNAELLQKGDGYAYYFEDPPNVDPPKKSDTAKSSKSPDHSAQ
ncbi:MAG: RRXRR domain-containing protein [Deltaproteobacteria bacterium]|nr:RRXRR domain-containing protein [Deltaproteobacteria bacterium]